MVNRNASPVDLVRTLGETTSRVDAIARGLPAEQLLVSVGGWSPNEILWHIRATADVYGEHIKRILDEDEPRWRHVSPRARMKKSRYDQLTFHESFAAFAHQRAELVDQLSALAPEAWERIALVRVDKRDQRLSLHERVWGMANHEEVHCRQLEEVGGALS